MWWLLAAVAAPPTVEVEADNSIHGVVVVAASPDVVRKKLADPGWVAEVDATGTQVEVVQLSGDCVVTDNVSPSRFKTVRYRVKQCPTTAGFATTLVESNTFDDYGVEWTLEPADGGTKITYDLMTDTSMMVPQFVINKLTRKSVLHMLTQIQGELGP